MNSVLVLSCSAHSLKYLQTLHVRTLLKTKNRVCINFIFELFFLCKLMVKTTNNKSLLLTRKYKVKLLISKDYKNIFRKRHFRQDLFKISLVNINIVYSSKYLCLM